MQSRRRFLGIVLPAVGGGAGLLVAAGRSNAVIVPPPDPEEIAKRVAAERIAKCAVEARLRRFYKRRVEAHYDEAFATELRYGSMMVACLFTRKTMGCLASTIRIEKEIWLDICQDRHEARCRVAGLDPERTTELPLQYPVFHLFNYVDPSTAYHPGWSGCRTHAYKTPYLDLREALQQALCFADQALQSGEWFKG